MPIHHATYTCNHCHETFDASSERKDLTACPCGKTHVRPGGVSTSYERGSDFQMVGKKTVYHPDDFVDITPRAQELMDALRAIDKEQGENRDYTKPCIYIGELTEELTDGTRAISSFWSNFNASNGKSYDGETNEVTMTLRFEKRVWGNNPTPEELEARLERYIAVVQSVLDGSFDPTDRPALDDYAQSNDLHGETEPTGATNYKLYI